MYIPSDQKLNITHQPCPAPAPSTTATTKPCTTPALQPTPKPVTCECPLVNCLAIWPGGCYCANDAAQACYDKCGGEPPELKSCEEPPSLEPYPNPSLEPYPSPSLEPFPFPSLEPNPENPCECDSIICVQSWPESCYCNNAAAEACNQKCGMRKAALQVTSLLPTVRICWYGVFNSDT